MRLTLFGDLKPFTRDGVLHNAIAGVLLASMNIPQVLGYARIAGMPVVTGLYTVLLPLLAFAAFGSSRHLIVAADSATAAILFNALSTWPRHRPKQRHQNRPDRRSSFSQDRSRSAVGTHRNGNGGAVPYVINRLDSSVGRRSRQATGSPYGFAATA